MAKNEAKITFTAETSEYNEKIKQAQNRMSELRAELRLNETQMNKDGSSVDALGNKQEILGQQLTAAKDKTEALTQKLKKAEELFGKDSQEASRLRVQLTNAQVAEEKIAQSVDRCNKELAEQKAKENQTESATEKLTKSIKEQQGELEGLKADYVEATLQYGENSREAKELENKIKSLSSELKENQTKMKKASDSADELDESLKDVGDGARESEEGFTVASGALADFTSNAIQGAIAKIGEFASYLTDLPEATREFRQDMATLETSFSNVEMSADTARETWKDLYAVFGEDDRAVETANHISKMAKNQEDLDKWVKITTGVWGTYQDSLPVEGLAEASNETAKTGKVTGVLADALNWSSEAAEMFSSYMSEDCTTAEDAFNKALEECSNSQERQELITETLTQLYGEAAEQYEETSGAQMDAKRAAAEQAEAEAELAEAVEPITTEFTELKTEFMTGVLPAVEKVTGAMLSAKEWMQEHPILASAIVGAVIGLSAALGGLAIAAGVYTVAQWAMNSAILANPITWIVVAIVAGAAAITAAGVAIYKNWDKIKQKAKEIKDGVVENFTKLKDGAVEKIDTAKEKVTGAVDKIKNAFKFKWSLPKISIPKFSVSGGKAPWGFGGKGSLPKIDVKWNKDGFIVNKASIIGQLGGKLMGAGEAGPEALTPISLLQDYIDRAFEKNIVQYATESGTGNVYNFYVNDATINDDAKMRDVAKNFVEELVRLGGMNR